MGNSELTGGHEAQRSRSQEISFIQYLFQDLAFRCKDAKRHRCKAAFILAEGATHVAHSQNIRRAAFTLAEVLITLGIIGVVAAMTMPSLITNYQKKVWTDQLKKLILP